MCQKKVQIPVAAHSFSPDPGNPGPVARLSRFHPSKRPGRCRQRSRTPLNTETERCFGLPYLFGGPKMLASPAGGPISVNFLRQRGRDALRRRADGVTPSLSLRGNSMRATSVGVVRIATKSPGDVSGLLSLIEFGQNRPEVDPRDTRQNRGKWRRKRLYQGIRRFRVMHHPGVLCRSASAARGRADRVRDVRRYGGCA